MPMTTSHCSWPALTRSASGSGSGSEATFTFLASSMSFAVRWKMKIGLERQNTLTICPSAIGARSMSPGAPAAIVEASGFIWLISGTSTAAAPTVATAPVAMYRKSRRVCSAEDTVVTSCPSPPAG